MLKADMETKKMHDCILFLYHMKKYPTEAEKNDYAKMSYY